MLAAHFDALCGVYALLDTAELMSVALTCRRLRSSVYQYARTPGLWTSLTVCDPSSEHAVAFFKTISAWCRALSIHCESAHDAETMLLRIIRAGANTCLTYLVLDIAGSWQSGRMSLVPESLAKAVCGLPALETLRIWLATVDEDCVLRFTDGLAELRHFEITERFYDHDDDEGFTHAFSSYSAIPYSRHVHVCMDAIAPNLRHIEVVAASSNVMIRLVDMEWTHLERLIHVTGRSQDLVEMARLSVQMPTFCVRHLKHLELSFPNEDAAEWSQVVLSVFSEAEDLVLHVSDHVTDFVMQEELPAKRATLYMYSTRPIDPLTNPKICIDHTVLKAGTKCLKLQNVPASDAHAHTRWSASVAGLSCSADLHNALSVLQCEFSQHFHLEIYP